MQKFIGKLSAIVFAMVMMLAMAMPAMAAPATLKITGLTAGDKVDLYQIGTAKADGTIEFISGVTFANVAQPTSQEIVEIAGKLQTSPAGITATKVVDAKAVADTEFTYETAAAGAFIAVVHSNTDKIYNPILLAANLKATGLVGGTVGAADKYKYGETAVAKSSTPGVKKEQTTGKTDTKDGQTIDTGSVGDRVSYTVTPDLPDYPEKAVNKTMYVSDTMTDGLTFEFDTLAVKLADDTDPLTRTDEGGIATFKKGNDVVATAEKVGNGFNLSFVFDKLNKKQPTVTYSAIINDKAVIGGTGNENHVEYFYSRNPSGGKTYENTNEKPQEDENIKKKEDKKVVYTYEIKFTKVDPAENNKPLEGAVFGLYEDQACTKLIDTITTNKQGIGASSKVGKGTYYLKELVPPTGYSLLTEVKSVEATWTSATTTTTKSTERTAYTSIKPAAPNDQQVGWLKDNKFYAMDEFTQQQATDSNGTILPAYLSAHTATEEATTFTETNTAGAGVVAMTDIPNTKLGELPSTGSIGTYLFTLIGVAATALAIGLVLVGKKRRKAE